MLSQVTNPKPFDLSSGFLTLKSWIHSLRILCFAGYHQNSKAKEIPQWSTDTSGFNFLSKKVDKPLITFSFLPIPDTLFGEKLFFRNTCSSLSHRSLTSATSGSPSWRIHHLPSLYVLGELLIWHDTLCSMLNVFPSSINSHLSFAFGIVPPPFEKMEMVGSKECEPLESMCLCCIPLPPFSFLFPFSLEIGGVKSHFLRAEITGMVLHLVFLPCL